jgi:single-stranded-DNA-specific exonuclease
VRVGDERGVNQKILNFSCTYNDFRFKNGECADILVTLDINEYNGTVSVSAQQKDIQSAGFNRDRHIAACAAYDSLRRGEEIEKSLSERVLPGKDDIRTVYDELKKNADLERVFAAVSEKLNYCKFKIILDVLKEFGLIEYNLIKNTAGILPAAEKADLESSEVLSKVKALAVL